MLLAGLAVAQSGASADAGFAAQIQPTLAQYCFECHSSAVQKGDLDLEQFGTAAAVRQQPGLWQNVLDQLTSGDMPPPKAKQPDAATRERLRAWIEAQLAELAAADAGDPGPVVLRRLDNAEYTYAVRDLTGIASLDPVREFPVDGAAGEGFANVGNALAMSPMLLRKFLDAGKAVAAHAVLLPDGIRFSHAATRRDQTDELLAQIRAFYRRFSDPRGADVVNVQGLVFTTNGGGRLPVAAYLQATLQLRALAAVDAAAVDAVASSRGLSPQYLDRLWKELNAASPSPLLDPLRRAWRELAADADVGPLVAHIAAWQAQLWQFRTVGHIGKVGGPQAWLEPQSPFVARQPLRLPLAAPTAGADADVTVWLQIGDAGDGRDGDTVVLRQPRLSAPGRADVPLRAVRSLRQSLATQRAELVASIVPCLAAAAAVLEAQPPVDRGALAAAHGVRSESLDAWFACLRVDAAASAVTLFADQQPAVAGRAEVVRWSTGELPCVLANSSAATLRIPGTLLPHSLAVHPTPTQCALVGWRSPTAARLRMEARIQHAHTDCGNGVRWAIELRRGALRLQLASGVAIDGTAVLTTAATDLPVQPGDEVVVLIGARDGDHTCDLTAIDLTLTPVAGDAPAWNLAADCADSLLAGNPHADSRGNAAVWWFGSEADAQDAADAVLPAASLLARWRLAAPGERAALANALQQLLADAAPAATSDDERLRQRLLASDGPLLRHWPAATAATTDDDDERYGLAVAQFDGDDLVLTAPTTLMVRLPAELAAGRELLATAELAAGSGSTGSVQLRASTAPPTNEVLWAGPILVRDAQTAPAPLAEAVVAHRELFPAALCYEQIVPVDEAVTLTLFHREDAHLARLMLDGAQRAELDRLWAELHFVSQDALTMVDVFEQLWQYATQDADPKVFEPLREPIRQRAAAFAQQLVAAEPRHLEAVLAFADRAYRRPLAAPETAQLRALYDTLRKEALPHDEVIRLLLARVLLAPAFLYRSEQPGPGAAAVPVQAHELVTRLAFLVWSSVPDAELRQAAADGRLGSDAGVLHQLQRLLADPRARRLASEFGGGWLHLQSAEQLGEKSERHFPGFVDLRPAMHEEVVLWLTDLLQRDGSVLELLDSDHTFLNGALAEHYGIAGVTGAEWRRVDGLRQHGRGGLLGMAAVLASQSGASRTSPILRGNWISEVLLGERLPRPPKDVPKLPDDEGEAGLTMRQLVERHRSDARCATCHDRIDPLGLALEGFDAVGRRRDHDLGGRAVDTAVTTREGASFRGADGLRQHLLTQRSAAFTRQFARKLLGYALGRAVQLSDQPLLQQIATEWPAHGHRCGWLLQRIVLSPQFRNVRGREHRDRGEQSR